MTAREVADELVYQLASGDQDGCMDHEDYQKNADLITAAINHAIAEELEACARLVETAPEHYMASEIAATIRARGK